MPELFIIDFVKPSDCRHVEVVRGGKRGAGRKREIIYFHLNWKRIWLYSGGTDRDCPVVNSGLCIGRSSKPYPERHVFSGFDCCCFLVFDQKIRIPADIFGRVGGTFVPGVSDNGDIGMYFTVVRPGKLRNGDFNLFQFFFR